jgi:hypothetical protein
MGCNKVVAGNTSGFECLLAFCTAHLFFITLFLIFIASVAKQSHPVFAEKQSHPVFAGEAILLPQNFSYIYDIILMISLFVLRSCPA